MINEDLTLSDLCGLDETLRRIRPNWFDEPPFIQESERGNKRAQYLAGVLSRVTYKRRKIRWAIYCDTPYLGFSEPWYRITAQTEVADAEGGGLATIQMMSVQITPDMTDEQIVRFAYRILEHFETHECREHFYFGESKIFDPHDEDKEKTFRRGF